LRLYFNQQHAEHTQKLVKESTLANVIECHEISERNWALYSLKDFQAIEIAEHLWIYPHWLLPEHPNQPYLVLDPGFAFGTGQHSTTKMCLEWLATHDLKQKVVIDYGCGSGILAIAALKLGAKKAYGVDIDPQACEASLQNAKLNHIPSQDFEIGLNNDSLPLQTDLLVANIVMNPLLEFRDFFYKKVKSQGYLVLSGLLQQQTLQVIKHYAECFKLIEQKNDLDWACLVFQPMKD
jgi:ribosomal protein L11 methyltransferase